MIDQYLEDLENRLDPEVEEQLLDQWRQFADGRFTGEVFSPRRARGIPPGVEWPAVSVNEAIANPENMLLQQFRTCSEEVARGGGGVLCVRANYGTGIVPSLFGAKLFMMSEDSDTLPTTWPLEGGETAIEGVLERGIPDLRAGLGAQVFDTGRLFLDTMARYPKIGRYVHLYHPDLQGPLDICELLWGSTMFLGLYDDPHLVARFLTLITDTYAAFMAEWRSLAPPADSRSVHWSMMHRGNIMLRDDSAMNLSSAMFDTFVAPYDGRLLREFGGGAMHFCGKGDHYIAQATALPGVNAIHMSQPEYNDKEAIFRATIDRGIPLLGLSAEAAAAARDSGRPLRGLVHAAL